MASVDENLGFTEKPVAPASADSLSSQTRISIKLMDCSNLPSSNTSKVDSEHSSLLAKVWCGGVHELKDPAALADEFRIQESFCGSHMSNPRFDSELIFPLAVDTLEDVAAGRVMVTLSDVKLNEGGVKVNDGDNLAQSSEIGRAIVSFGSIFEKGRVLKNSVHLNSEFFSLKKTKKKSMAPRTDPKIRMSISFFLSDEINVSKFTNGSCESFVEVVHLLKKRNGCEGKMKRRERKTNTTDGRVRSRRVTRERSDGSYRATSLSPSRYVHEHPILLRSPRNEEVAAEAFKAGSEVDHEQEVLDTKNDFTRSSTPPAPVQIPNPHSRDQQQQQQHQHQHQHQPSPPKHSPRFPLPNLSSNSYKQNQMNKKAANVWKNKLLQSLSRLDDKDTLLQALGELHQIILFMRPHQISTFIYQLSKQSQTASLAARKSLLQLLQFLATQHPQHCNANNMVDLIVKHARHPEQTIQQQCQNTMSAIVRHVFPHSSLNKDGSGHFFSALDPLFAVFSEQTTTTKETAGACLAVAIRPYEPTLPVTITANARNLEDVRHAFRRLEKAGCRISLPKETVVLPNGSILLFANSAAKIKLLQETLSSKQGVLPSNWKVEDFSSVEKFFLGETLFKHCRSLESYLDILLQEIIGAMSRSGGADGELFRGVQRLCDNVIEFDNRCPKLKRILKHYLPQLFARAIPSLNNKNKKKWKERVEVALFVAKVAFAEIDDEFLSNNLQRITDSLKKAKAGVKGVREACQAALDALGEATSRRKAGAGADRSEEAAGGIVDDQNNVDFRELTDIPPIKFDENEPQVDIDMGSVDDDENFQKNDNQSMNYTDKEMKTKKKKYAYQRRKPGGLRSPRHATASGSGTATVRLLKELGNKSVAMQRSLDDLANATKGLQQNVREIEVEVRAPARKKNEIEEQIKAATVAAAEQQQQMQKPLSDKEIFFRNQGIDIRYDGHVSLWREVQWLLHCGEVETAFQRVLDSCSRNDLLRLMGKSGASSLRRISDNTLVKLMNQLSNMLTDGVYVDHLLPWIFTMVQTSMVKRLPLCLRENIAGGLLKLSESPDEHGVLAAKLHRHLKN